MNNNLWYVLQRKSFHLLRNIGNEQIIEDELKSIENVLNTLKQLVEDIEIKII